MGNSNGLGKWHITSSNKVWLTSWQYTGIQLSLAWTISVPPFDSFQKAGTKLFDLVFDSS